MNWADFTALVKEEIPVDSIRLGTDKFFARTLRAAAGDMQSFLPWLRVGQVTPFAVADFTTDGLAAYVTAPDGVLREVWLVHSTADESRPGSSNRTPLTRRTWAWKDAMVAGVETAAGSWMLSPDLCTLWISPHLLTGQTLSVTWDGTREDFANATVLGSSWSVAGVVKAAAEYVRSNFQTIIHKDFNAGRIAMGEYAKLRQRLYADFKEKENA